MTRRRRTVRPRRAGGQAGGVGGTVDEEVVAPGMGRVGRRLEHTTYRNTSASPPIGRRGSTNYKRPPG